MNKALTVSAVSRVNSLLASYEKGDLLKAVSIREAIEELRKVFLQAPALEKLAVLSTRLLRVADSLSFPDTETTALQLLQEILRNMELFFRGKISGKDFGTAVRSRLPMVQKLLSTKQRDSDQSKERTPEVQPASLTTQLSEIAKEETLQTGYPEGYFDGIVEDSSLLMQFFHEAKDHLEEAQSTLVELEYDTTNKELLNTIFRNFHTIKGSSAFLGLKNIE
ncbi:MAG TPA: Hpt domain-containing protein, partial [Spirochaetales bacterium]|nr:Hpt domain-containing protein [Spirochaetales bacterium]